jgi:hydrogenase expression/formation protein HypC
MCLGIPGRLVEMLDHEHLAKVDVAGVGRVINIGLLEDEDLVIGDWVLIHVGFALSKIDEDEAARALASLQLLGQAYDDELEAFWSSQIAGDQAASAAAEAAAEAAAKAAGAVGEGSG